LVLPLGLVQSYDGECRRQDRQWIPKPVPPRSRHHHGSGSAIGFDRPDREFDKLGYDIESRVPGTGKLRSWK